MCRKVGKLRQVGINHPFLLRLCLTGCRCYRCRRLRMLQARQPLTIIPAYVGIIVSTLPVGHPLAPYIRVGTYARLHKLVKGVWPDLPVVDHRVILHPHI